MTSMARAAALGTAVLWIAAQLPAAAGDAVQAHVEFLAAPELEGRLTGSDGEARAVDYIIEQLERIGAKPLPGADGFRQPFEFTAGMNDGGTTMSLRGEGDESATGFEGGEQVRSLSFSDNASVTGSVVFAGYGLKVSDEEELSYDSFFGLDLEGKIALVLRYFPEDVEDEQRVLLARQAGLRYKALQVRERGAKALLIVTGPRSPNAGETVPMSFDTALSGSGIVAASIGKDVADLLFAHVEGKTLEEVQASLDGGNPHVTGFEIPGVTVTIDARVERERRTGHNVVAYLPAQPAEQARGAEAGTLLLGAHLDHLGHGKHGNSLARKGETGQIHLGADDNASGVAAVLAVATRLAQQERPLPIALGFWSGEELGLLGSTAFLDDGPLAAESIAAYVNFDMVGRMSDNRLSLQAVGSSSVWPGLIERTNVVAGFDVQLRNDPYLPTDAIAFYQAGVPVLDFFTGSHDDYHRPTDAASTVNYEDLQRIVGFATSLVGKLAGLPERPDHVEVAPDLDRSPARGTVRAFTGTIPDYTTEVEGLRLSGVVEDGPADQAGLREGDVIVEFAGQTIANIYDYTFALEVARIDEPVEVVVLRDGERMTVTLTPTSRK